MRSAANIVAITLGVISTIAGIAMNSTGTERFGMITSDTTHSTTLVPGGNNVDFTFEFYIGIWLSRSTEHSDVQGSSSTLTTHEPEPFYCNQDKNNENNNCIIGRSNYDTQCCQNWTRRCRSSKTMGVVATVLAFLSVCLSAFDDFKMFGFLVSFIAAMAFLVVLSVHVSYVQLDYWKTEGIEVNKDGNCGLRGWSFNVTGNIAPFTFDFDFRLAAGWGMAFIGFFLSLCQSMLFCYMKLSSSDKAIAPPGLNSEPVNYHKQGNMHVQQTAI